MQFGAGGSIFAWAQIFFCPSPLLLCNCHELMSLSGRRLLNSPHPTTTTASTTRLRQAALTAIWRIIKTFKRGEKKLSSGAKKKKRHYLVICAERRYLFSSPNGKYKESPSPPRTLSTFVMNYSSLHTALYLFFTILPKCFGSCGSVMDSSCTYCDSFFVSRAINIFAAWEPSRLLSILRLDLYSAGSKNIPGASDREWPAWRGEVIHAIRGI